MSFKFRLGDYCSHITVNDMKEMGFIIKLDGLRGLWGEGCLVDRGLIRERGKRAFRNNTSIC